MAARASAAATAEIQISVEGSSSNEVLGNAVELEQTTVIESKQQQEDSKDTVHRIETIYGDMVVRVRAGTGSPKARPVLLTYHDIGVNRTFVGAAVVAVVAVVFSIVFCITILLLLRECVCCMYVVCCLMAGLALRSASISQTLPVTAACSALRSGRAGVSDIARFARLMKQQQQQQQRQRSWPSEWTGTRHFATLAGHEVMMRAPTTSKQARQTAGNRSSSRSSSSSSSSRREERPAIQYRKERLECMAISAIISCSAGGAGASGSGTS
jgi:hypothetical protein